MTWDSRKFLRLHGRYGEAVGHLEGVGQRAEPSDDPESEVDTDADEGEVRALDGDSLGDRIESLIPIVGRVVRSRVQDPAAAEDLIQETLARVLAKADRVDPRRFEAYAIVTAENVV